jgi:hypothetical protein
MKRPSRCSFPAIHYRGLELDIIMCVVLYRGRSLRQEAVEYRTLACLMRQPTKPVPYRSLVEEGFGWAEFDEAGLPSIFGRVAHYINKRFQQAGAPYNVSASDGALVLREALS